MTALRLALYVDFLAWLASQLETAIHLETSLNQRLKGGES